MLCNFKVDPIQWTREKTLSLIHILMSFADNSNVFLQNIFVGTILTATSVSITVETLKEMGKLNSKVGNTILGAAIIDDILGIVALTVVISFSSSDVHIVEVLLKIVLFFVFAIIASGIFYVIFKNWLDKDAKHKLSLIHIFFCILPSEPVLE